MPYDESIGPEPTGRRRRRGIRGEWFQCAGCGEPFTLDAMGKSGRCVPCSRAYWRAWAKANRARLQAGRALRAAEVKQMADHKDRALLLLAREDPEHFVKVWEMTGMSDSGSPDIAEVTI